MSFPLIVVVVLLLILVLANDSAREILFGGLGCLFGLGVILVLLAAIVIGIMLIAA